MLFNNVHIYILLVNKKTSAHNTKIYIHMIYACMYVKLNAINIYIYICACVC
jgi:hypothetical protein